MNKMIKIEPRSQKCLTGLQEHSWVTIRPYTTLTGPSFTCCCCFLLFCLTLILLSRFIARDGMKKHSDAMKFRPLLDPPLGPIHDASTAKSLTVPTRSLGMKFALKTLLYALNPATPPEFN